MGSKCLKYSYYLNCKLHINEVESEKIKQFIITELVDFILALSIVIL